MDILIVSPEVIPFARAGGLSDVTFYLARALVEKGHRARIITPKHRLTEDAGYPLEQLSEAIPIQMARRERQAKFYSAPSFQGVETIFIGCDELYNRAGIYGNEFGDYEDNAERFIFFCKAVLECIKNLEFKPDIIHCHDWQTGLVPAYLKTVYRSLPNIKQTAAVFTFHNLGTQGIFDHYDFTSTGLDWKFFTSDFLEHNGKLNMAKAGLVFSDAISTVSRKYAQEVLTPEYGFGLEEVLAHRRDDLYSVLNGVDYQVWNPKLDINLEHHYWPEDMSGKQKCRSGLIEEFELNADEAPVLAVIARLLDRKGLDLVTVAMDRLMEAGLKVVIHGEGEDKYYVRLQDFANTYPDQIGLSFEYEKSMAHRILAGADMLLMPSRYEPCGLEQLYGLKYGTVPVVRATGGLDDTIVDYTQNPELGSGFKFKEYTAEALIEAVERAVRLFQDKQAWAGLILKGMAQEFSWADAALKYEQIYMHALDKVNRL